MRTGTGGALIAATVIAGLAAGCSPGDDERAAEPVSTYTITQATQTMEVVLGEVARVVEDELGSEGWRQLDPPEVTYCGESGTSRYWSGVRAHGRAIPPERWPGLWERILAAVEPHGFTDRSGDAGSDGSHFLRLQNSHDDTLTISTTQPDATAYRGDSGCHPGYIELPPHQR